ncbi:MAG: hypothetical protein ABGX16_14930 [Pirellulales bacterium]
MAKAVVSEAQWLGFMLALVMIPSVRAQQPEPLLHQVVASKKQDGPARRRRILYNFDGDSCMTTKVGNKGPVAITVDDFKRLIEEVAYDGSQVDSVLVCINAQAMYYPTKVGRCAVHSRHSTNAKTGPLGKAAIRKPQTLL